MLTENSAFACSLVLILSVGCRSTGERGGASGTLPFVVKINEVEIDVLEEDADTPPIFSEPTELTRSLADSLSEAGVFTRVLTEDDPDFPPDLELDITIRGSDFGLGDTQAGSATLSTIVWLFGGHLSSFITNRYYPASNVMMNVAIRQPERATAGGDPRAGEELFRHDLLLKGLELALSERAGLADWLLNIFVPPCWLEGDREVRGTSLARRSVEFFAENEPARILAGLPGKHHQILSCLLVHDAEKNEIVIVARGAVRRVTLSTFPGSSRSLEGVRIATREVPDSGRDEMRLRLSRLEAGVGLSPLDFLYRIKLEDSERGWVRVQAVLEGSTGRWTIHRSPATGDSPARIAADDGAVMAGDDRPARHSEPSELESDPGLLGGR